MGCKKPRSSKKFFNLEIRNMLAEKARMEITQKLKEWSTTAASPEVIKNDLRRNKTAHDAVVDSKILCEKKKWSVFSAPVDLGQLMTVPDSDFHNFDNDRTENSFDGNQVWATYDEDDVMSRYYVLIHKVISKNPFKVQFSWLNSKSNSELDPINWVHFGFSKTSGDFRIGKYKPIIRSILSQTRHWSPNWNKLTPDDIIHNYDIVEVLGDYTEKAGVTVAPLVKVAGFMSVFRQHSDPKYFLHIPREEMFRFSHQALRNVADTSNLERTSGEIKEEEKFYVVGDNNVTKGEEDDRDSKSVSNITHSDIL
ncbi:hypothetical protein HAX54_024123 [Datura stramonium]|uniref:DUF3444 domain-containing protein n=1 Tax=Datura stramonium TaxID=4076 RepID=A0ABS8V0C6_DATST|nr:hypothetical protein [Datura stramonium]